MKSETFKLRINMNFKKNLSHICNIFISPYAV